MALIAGALLAVAGCTPTRFPPLDLSTLPGVEDHPDDGEVVLLEDGTITFDLVDGKPVIDLGRRVRVRVLSEAGLRRDGYATGLFVDFEPGVVDLLEFEARVLAPHHAACAADDAPAHCRGVYPGIGRLYERADAKEGGRLERRMVSRGRWVLIEPKHLQVGSVVEYDAVQRYHDAHLRGFNVRMAGREPSLVQRLTFDAPIGWEIEIVPRQRGQRMTGWLPVTSTEAGRRREVWSLEDVDAIPRENHDSDLWALAPALNFRIKTWIDADGVAHTPLPDRHAIGTFFAREIAKRNVAEVTPAIRKAAEGLVADAASPAEKARRLHDWVRWQIRHINIEAELSGMLPNRADDVLERRFGRRADIAMLLVTMLQAVGIESHLVYLYRYSLVNREPDVPSILWNHDTVAVQVTLPDGPAWAFPGQRTVPFGRIPGAYQNATAIRISDPGEDFEIGAEPPHQHLNTLDLTLSVTPDGEVTGTFRSESTGRFADRARSILAGAGQRSRRWRIPGFLDIEGEVHRLDRIEGLRGRGPLNAVSLSGELTTNNRIEVDAPGAWALRPSEFVRLDAPELPPGPRFGPVIFGRPRSHLDRIALTLPPGWTVDLPADERVDGTFADFEIRYRREGRTLRIERRLEVSTSEIEVEQYDALRHEWMAIRQLDRRPIIIDRRTR